VQGYMLVYESMLTSVITARDKWLKPVSFNRFTLIMYVFCNCSRRLGFSL